MKYSTINNWNKQSKTISINNLLVLCEIGDNYKSFCDDLEELTKSKKNKDLGLDLYNNIQGKFSLRANRYKSFIKKHKDTIEIMNKYGCLINFIVLSYNSNGERKNNLTEDYFYQYIQQHKKDIEEIKSVALKIKQLGFEKIEFVKDVDFTKFEYELKSYYRSKICFLENMEIIPSYSSDDIKYKTNDSCYCMYLDGFGHGTAKQITKYDKSIYLNSLEFNPSKLPNEITTESTIGIIQKLAKEKQSGYKDIKDFIDLSITTDNLKSQYEHYKKVVEKIDKVKNNDELKELLKQMENIMIHLQTFSETFETNILNSNEDITNETINKEKTLHANKAFYDSINLD